MFTDLVGYSRMAQEDEARALACVDTHRRLVRELLPRHGGREIETTGDGFLIEFGSVVHAAAFAIALQRRHATHGGFQIRIGLHLGDVEARGRQIIGDGVNLAARIEPLAPHGGIAISAPVHALLRGKLPAPFQSIGTPALKNIAGPPEVFTLDAEGVQAAALPLELPPPAPQAPFGLLLVALAQVLAGVLDLFFGGNFIVLAALETGVPRDATLSLAYGGFGITLCGMLLIGASYGLARGRRWARAGSLALNFANVPLAIAAMSTLGQTLRQIGHTFMFPTWFQLIAPLLSLALIAYLLRPAVTRHFARDAAT